MWKIPASKIFIVTKQDLFALYRDGDFALMSALTMLPQKHPLPHAQRAAAVRDGEGDFALRQHAADMRAHIVIAFQHMVKTGVAIGDEAGEIIFQIEPNIGVGVLGDDQGSAGVMDENMAQPGVDAAGGDRLFHLPGDVGGRAGTRFDADLLLFDHDERA